MWSTVVPTWNTHKYPKLGMSFRLWYLGALWGYIHHMGNPQERTPWSDSVAAQLRAERAAAGHTQDAMIRLSGIPRSTYIRLEKGTRVADASQLARICGALGLSLSEFFRRVEQRHPEGRADALG